MSGAPSPSARSFFLLFGRVVTILAATFGLYLAFIHLQEAFSRDCREDNKRQEFALFQLRQEILELHGQLAAVGAQNDRIREDLDRLDGWIRSPLYPTRREP
jgi:hypothetical protein